MNPPQSPSAAGSRPLPLSASSDPSLIHYSELQRLNIIGSGTGGTVYKVLHGPSGEFYALKIMKGNHDDGQVLREVEIHRDLDNPYVVKCHNHFDENGEIQLLLEYMDGGSLEGKHIPQEPLLSDYTRQILSGLDYLHSRKIVHGDINPSNVLVDSQGNVKISDFGVSRIQDQTGSDDSPLGAEAYMSPERLKKNENHESYDGYSGDIWSLGLTILEIYLGMYPYIGWPWKEDPMSQDFDICMYLPPEAAASSSGEFREFISRCILGDPAERWSARQLLSHAFIVQNSSSGSNVNVDQANPPHPPSD